jgi:hypothetical protein
MAPYSIPGTLPRVAFPELRHPASCGNGVLADAACVSRRASPQCARWTNRICERRRVMLIQDIDRMQYELMLNLQLWNFGRGIFTKRRKFARSFIPITRNTC